MLKIGTRASKLAIAQTQIAINTITDHKLHALEEIELMKISTTGDRFPGTNLSELGGKGVFVKELDLALLNGSIDLAVHSLKDLPTTLAAGITIGAILPRASYLDVMILHPKYQNITDLPLNAQIGTSAPRRICQLTHSPYNFQAQFIRGNINTRLQKLQDGQYDGIILAEAGLQRIGYSGPTHQLEDHIFVPSPGQGAIAITCRQGEHSSMLAAINHQQSFDTVVIERDFARLIGGNCQTPLGTLVVKHADTWTLQAMLAASAQAYPVYISHRYHSRAQLKAALPTLADDLIKAACFSPNYQP